MSVMFSSSSSSLWFIFLLGFVSLLSANPEGFFFLSLLDFSLFLIRVPNFCSMSFVSVLMICIFFINGNMNVTHLCCFICLIAWKILYVNWELLSYLGIAQMQQL